MIKVRKLVFGLDAEPAPDSRYAHDRVSSSKPAHRQQAHPRHPFHLALQWGGDIQAIHSRYRAAPGQREAARIEAALRNPGVRKFTPTRSITSLTRTRTLSGKRAILRLSRSWRKQVDGGGAAHSSTIRNLSGSISVGIGATPRNQVHTHSVKARSPLERGCIRIHYPGMTQQHTLKIVHISLVTKR